jgi:hypothetical protein
MTPFRLTISAAGARQAILGLAVTGALFAAGSVPAFATAGFGSLYLDGAVVGTTVVPAPVPAGSGQDPFFEVTNGVPGQLGIAGVGPGDGAYHGGDWEFFSVTFNTAPYLLTSGDAVMAAAARGDVTVVRVPGNDFRCPVTRS